MTPSWPPQSFGQPVQTVPDLELVRRVVVVGGPGSGKSTLARHVAAAIGAQYLELDALWWQVGWKPSDPVEFAMRTRDRLLNAGRWVVDGNYFDAVGVAEVWPAADKVIWLDLPRRIAFRRRFNEARAGP